MYKFLLACILTLSLQPMLPAAGQVGNALTEQGWQNRLQNSLQTHGELLNQVIEASYYNKSARDIEAIKQKLLSNAHDLSMLFSSILGKDAGAAFEPLFDEHIKLGGEYINAAKKGLSTKQQIAQQALTNGNQIADLFSKWFSSIPDSEWRQMLAEHVNLEAEQADAYFNNDISKGKEIKDKTLTQLHQLGNLLIQGIDSYANRSGSGR